MILRIDVGSAPPLLTLLESDDLKAFKAEVTVGSHLWVAPEQLERLGPASAEWKRGLEAMVAFAAEHGWTDDEGRVRAHVEMVEAGTEPQAD
jgi:hypothetical protein